MMHRFLLWYPQMGPSASANPFYTALPSVCDPVSYSSWPLARISPFWGSRRQEITTGFRVVPGSVASLSKKSGSVRTSYVWLPPSTCFLHCGFQFILSPPSPECVMPDFFLSRLSTTSPCVCVTSQFVVDVPL